MRNLQLYFAGVPYVLNIDNENNFHNAFYILMSLLGINVKAEVTTSDRRIDMVISTSGYLYIIELKYDESAEKALRQIIAKQYARPYSGSGKVIYTIGVSFSSKTRCPEDWIIERSGT